MKIQLFTSVLWPFTTAWHQLLPRIDSLLSCACFSTSNGTFQMGFSNVECWNMLVISKQPHAWTVNAEAPSTTTPPFRHTSYSKEELLALLEAHMDKLDCSRTNYYLKNKAYCTEAAHFQRSLAACGLWRPGIFVDSLGCRSFGVRKHFQLHSVCCICK